MLKLHTRANAITVLSFLFSCSIIFSSSAISVYAQELQFDQRCFTESACTDLRTGLGTFDPDRGFVQNQTSNQACTGVAQMNAPEKVGFCIAGGETETTVKIGGRTEFTDITEFIAYIFRFSFSVAIALAVVMILVSGIQWMSSGGNSSIIEDAKKRIINTALGLFLLAMSYTILDTINPALVRLKPLDIYLINPIEVAPEYCSDIENTPPLYAATRAGSTTRIPFTEINLSQPISVSNATCGQEFYIQNAGEQTCRGSVCTTPQNSFCAPKIVNNEISTSEYGCTNNFTAKINLSTLTGMATVGNPLALALSNVKVILNENWLGNEVEIYTICESTEDTRNFPFISPRRFTNIFGGDRIVDPINISTARIQKGPVSQIFNNNVSEYYFLQIPNFKQFLQNNISCERPIDTPIGGIIRLKLNVDYTERALGLPALRGDKYVYIGANGEISDRLSNVLGQEFTSNMTFSSIHTYNLTNTILSEIKDYHCTTNDFFETFCMESILQN